MKYNKDGSFELNSGKKIYTASGIIGISPDDKTMGMIYHGFDDNFEDLTLTDKIEISHYMIDVWVMLLNKTIAELEKTHPTEEDV